MACLISTAEISSLVLIEMDLLVIGLMVAITKTPAHEGTQVDVKFQVIHVIALTS